MRVNIPQEIAGFQQIRADFDGETYLKERDELRLRSQSWRVFQAMIHGYWRTLAEIQIATGDPQASISARLRDFRKEKFGGYLLERRHRGPASRGIYEYRLSVPDEGAPVQGDLL